MRYRKFFFDLLYIKGDLAARHPDFFVVHEKFRVFPDSMETVVDAGRDFVITDRNVYVKRDKVLFKMGRGADAYRADEIVESDVWNILKSRGKVYFVEVDSGFSSMMVYYIFDGRYVYPVRVTGQLVTIFLPNGYVSTNVENFEMIRSFDEAATKLKKIYNHSFVDDSVIRGVLEEGRSVKGLKFIIYPGTLQLWRGAYTINVFRDDYVMVDPVRATVHDPLVMVSSPYLAAFLM